MKRLLLALVALPAVSAIAHADIVILDGPGNVFGDENVLYNEGSLLDNGPMVQGITNKTDTIVDFSNAGQNLVTPSGGQARIEGTSGDFNSMNIQLDSGDTYTSLILNLNAVADGTVTFDVHPAGESVFTETFNIDKNGENFFRILATNGEAISLTDFTTTAGLHDVRQVRIGFGNPVPEPATCSALGLGALALLRRRKSRKA